MGAMKDLHADLAHAVSVAEKPGEWTTVKRQPGLGILFTLGKMLGERGNKVVHYDLSQVCAFSPTGIDPDAVYLVETPSGPMTNDQMAEFIDALRFFMDRGRVILITDR